MTDMPEDAMKAAAKALEEFWKYDDSPRTQKIIIAEAILAERERCAKVADINQKLAELDATTFAHIGNRKSATVARITAMVAGVIAHKIRKGTP